MKTKLLTGLIALTFILSSCVEVAEQPEPGESAQALSVAQNAQTTESTAVPEISGLKYGAAPGLTNVENISHYPNLTANQRVMLEKNLFVVTPANRHQLSYIYEENEYLQIPSFITTDSVLHLYHMFFSNTLSAIEHDYLANVCAELSVNMLDEARRLSNEAKDAAVLDALEACKVYFAAAANLIGESVDTRGINEELMRQELALVEQHSGFIESPLTGQELFYDSFLPRGHYTKNDTLTRYFKTMSWYGNMSYPVSDARDQDFLRAMVTAYTLMSLPEEKGQRLWENIYEPTAFFVGATDDITPYDVWNAMLEVYGTDIHIDKLSDPDALAAFAEKIKEYDKARIVNENSFDGVSADTRMQFRFMGQRYVPDSEMLQRLSKPLVRPVPSGLDMAAVLGASNAEKFIYEYMNPTEPHEFGFGWADYPDEFAKVKADFAALGEETWRSNMYYGWLWTIASSFDKPSADMPSFMQSGAWYDKQLATGLGSWAQLRHDTILYAKQSGAEKGGGFLEIPKGYVEPNIELYYRLRWLTDYSATILLERGMISEFRAELCRDIVTMLDTLIDISRKQLNNEQLTDDDYSYILSFGGRLENLMIRSMQTGDSWDDILSERRMGVIADVHNTTFGFLHEAVGLANEIFVIVPVEDKLYLARGAVFDYYELFLEEKYTDEMWLSWLEQESDKLPARPPWTQSFIDTTGIGQEIPYR